MAWNSSSRSLPAMIERYLNGRNMKAALLQIQQKKYDAELLNLGIAKGKIRHYGFAFEGKKVLIGA